MELDVKLKKKVIEVGEPMEENGAVLFEESCPFWELEWITEVTKVLKIKDPCGEENYDIV